MNEVRLGGDPRAVAQLFSEEMEDDFSAARPSPVFEKINPLPGSKHHAPRSNRDGQLRLRERGPYMCRHVVWPLRPVDIALAVFWSDCFEKVFEIRLNIRIGVFLNEKRGRRMAAEYRQKAARNILLPEPKRDFAADFNEAFGRRLDVQRMKCLPHGMEGGWFCGFHRLPLPGGCERSQARASAARLAVPACRCLGKQEPLEKTTLTGPLFLHFPALRIRL